MLAVVLIGLCVAGYFVVPWAIDTFVNTADRKIRRGTYAKNQEIVRTRVTITAPIAPTELIASVAGAVAAPRDRPAVVGGLYMKGYTASDGPQRGVHWGFGSKMVGDQFVATLEAVPTASGSYAAFEIPAWEESGADVIGTQAMESLRQKIKHEVVAIGGTVSEN